jgi:hypothetical protein
MKKERDWYKQKGKMMLFKNDKLIREYRYNDIYKRRAILRIWNIEVKFNGNDKYELIIRPD